jgi:hypothetical protein
MGVTFLGSDSTQVEFAMRWRDFNRPQRVTQKFDAHPITVYFSAQMGV